MSHAGRGVERPGHLLPMHPMTVADVLDGSFRTWRSIIGPAVLGVLVVRGPVELISNLVVFRQAPELLVGTTAFGDPGFVDLGTMGWVMLFGLIGGVFSVYAAATVVALVVEADRGRRPALGAALRSALRPTVMALVAILLLVLAGMAASLATVVVALVPFVGFVVLLGAMPIGIGVAVSLGALVAPIAVVERQGPLATLGRAVWVLRVRFWRTIGIAWLLLIVLLGVSLGLSVVLEAVAAATGPAAWAVLALSTLLLSVVQLPVVSIAALLVFLDARMLREAFDLEVRLTHLAAG